MRNLRVPPMLLSSHNRTISHKSPADTTITACIASHRVVAAFHVPDVTPVHILAPDLMAPAPPRPAWLRAIVHDIDVDPRTAHAPSHATAQTRRRQNTYSATANLPPYDKDLQCKHCGKVFRRVCNYREHQRVHSNEYKFVCNIPGCTRKFMWRSSIQAHLRSHQAKLQRRRARSPIAKLPLQNTTTARYIAAAAAVNSHTHTLPPPRELALGNST